MTEAGVVSLVGSLLGLLVGGAVLLVSENPACPVLHTYHSRRRWCLNLPSSWSGRSPWDVDRDRGSTYPAYAAARMDPYEAMTRGE